MSLSSVIVTVTGGLLINEPVLKTLVAAAATGAGDAAARARGQTKHGDRFQGK